MAYHDVLLQLVVLHVNGLGHSRRELRATLTLQALGRGIARRGAEKRQRLRSSGVCGLGSVARHPRNAHVALGAFVFDRHNMHRQVKPYS